MNKKLNFVLVAASALLATASFAAEPCKAYVRLDLGYGMASGTRAYGPAFNNNNGAIASYQYDAGLDKDQRGMVGDVAVGYAFNDAMRGEVSFDFKPQMTAHSYTFGVQTQELGGSAKVLYDFNNNTPVTPFLFGGLGATNIKSKLKPYNATMFKSNGQPYLGQINSDGSIKQDANGNVFTYSSLNMPSKTVMTYQAGFGLAFKASEQVSLDLTYGLGGKTNYQVLVNTATLSVPAGQAVTEANASDEARFKQIKFKNQMDQSLTLGVRFTM